MTPLPSPFFPSFALGCSGNHGDTFHADNSVYAAMGKKDSLWGAMRDSNPYGTLPSPPLRPPSSGLPRPCVLNVKRTYRKMWEAGGFPWVPCVLSCKILA